MKRPGVGVVIGRFQTDELHPGHIALIDAADKHHRLVVFIGVSPYLVTPADPLDFAAREQMIKERYPHAVVISQPDRPFSDAVWSSEIDEGLRRVFPLDKPTLYFGRGSSRAFYLGRHTTTEIDEVHHVSATNIRESVGKSVLNNAGWRAGVIYAAHNMWPRAVPAVDVAIYRKGEKENDPLVLVGRRDNEGGVYRFPGGHVDIRDSSYEAAVLREAGEETGGNLELATPEYIGSFRAKSGSNWTMFTSFYSVAVLFGDAVGSDDLDHVHWFPLSQLENLRWADAHGEMAQRLSEWWSRKVYTEEQNARNGILNKTDWEFLQEMLLNPPAPSPALVELFRKNASSSTTLEQIREVTQLRAEEDGPKDS